MKANCKSGAMRAVALGLSVTFLGLIVAALGDADSVAVHEIQGARGIVFYFYEKSCFPPDNRAECGSYFSEVRVGTKGSFTTKIIFNCKCFFGEPVINRDFAEVSLEENQNTSENMLLIDLQTGEAIGMTNM
jgi:hypothetical protein